MESNGRNITNKKKVFKNLKNFSRVLYCPSRVLKIISNAPIAKIKIERVLAVFRSLNQKLRNWKFNLRELFHFAIGALGALILFDRTLREATRTLTRTADLLKNNIFLYK